MTGGRVVASAPSSIPPFASRCCELERRGFEVAWAPVDRRGVIDAGAFAELVAARVIGWPR